MANEKRQFTQIMERITATIFDTLRSPKLRVKIAKYSTRQIKRRTRRGFGVKNKELVKLKPLLANTVRSRRNLRKNSKLSGNTSPTKSNLTESGKMLNDLGSEGTRTGVKIILKSDKSREKAKFNIEDGREFMDLSKQEEDAVADLVAEEVVTALKKIC